MNRNSDPNTIIQQPVGQLDKVVVEYALSDIHKPIGVSEYQLTHSLPRKWKSSLPSIGEIEKELRKK